MFIVNYYPTALTITLTCFSRRINNINGVSVPVSVPVNYSSELAWTAAEPPPSGLSKTKMKFIFTVGLFDRGHMTSEGLLLAMLYVDRSLDLQLSLESL